MQTFNQEKLQSLGPPLVQLLPKLSYIRVHPIKYFFTSRLPRQIKLVWEFSDIMQATINGRALSTLRA